MDFQKIIERALQIRNKYSNFEKKKWGKSWGNEQILQGFVGDVGDLVKLVMEKEGWRKLKSKDSLGHELSDCLWNIIVLADKYDVNLEKEFEKTMTEIERRIDTDLDH